MRKYFIDVLSGTKTLRPPDRAKAQRICLGSVEGDDGEGDGSVIGIPGLIRGRDDVLGVKCQDLQYWSGVCIFHKHINYQYQDLPKVPGFVTTYYQQ